MLDMLNTSARSVSKEHVQPGSKEYTGPYGATEHTEHYGSKLCGPGLYGSGKHTGWIYGPRGHTGPDRATEYTKLYGLQLYGPNKSILL